jgi:hypothetical protein
MRSLVALWKSHSPEASEKAAGILQNYSKVPQSSSGAYHRRGKVFQTLLRNFKKISAPCSSGEDDSSVLPRNLTLNDV